MTNNGHTYSGDNLTPEQRLRAMQAVHSRDTSPELALRAALRRQGVLGYRIDQKALPGKPDIAFSKAKLAVFIDGGWWHGRSDRIRPGRSEYWDRKIAGNVARDRRHEDSLRQSGWRVLRFWDDEVLEAPDRIAGQIKRALNPLPAAEFFAGIGLVRQGIEAAGFKVVFANDNDPIKFTMYRDNFGTDDFLLADVRALTGDDIPTVALATASFPCTDLSLAGLRRGLNGSESGLFWHFSRILREMGERRPPVIVIENVSSFSSSKDGDDLKTAIEELNDLGYWCDVVQLDARLWVPQSRPRMFIIGSIGPFAEPSNWQPMVIRPEWIKRFVLRNPSLKLQAAPLIPPSPKRVSLSSIIDRFPPSSPKWWDSERLTKFLESLSGIQAARLEALRNSEQCSWRTAYRRTRQGRPTWEIRADDISGCLRTARGGSSKQAVVETGAGEVRVRWMTSAEYARLMGAPTTILTGVTESQALFGLGDAVCVPAVSWLAREYLAPLLYGEFTTTQETPIGAAT